MMKTKTLLLLIADVVWLCINCFAGDWQYRSMPMHTGGGPTPTPTPGCSSPEILRVVSDVSTQWTPSTGVDNYALVSDESDVTYNSVADDAGDYQTDEYQLANTSCSSGQTITNVTVSIRAQCSTGTCDNELRLGLYYNSIDDWSDTVTPIAAFGDFEVVNDNIEPFASGSWTSAIIDAMTVKINSRNIESGDQINVSDVEVSVTYE